LAIVHLPGSVTSQEPTHPIDDDHGGKWLLIATITLRTHRRVYQKVFALVSSWLHVVA
jgi:hypothetical protein